MMNWKNLIFVTLMAGTVIACNNTNKQQNAHNHENEPHEHPENVVVTFADENTGNVYHHYIHLKDALIENNNEEAQKGAGELEAALIAIEKNDIAEQAAQIKNVADIESKRALLDKLSEQLSEFFKANKPTVGVIYKQNCPMANNDNGGSWLASEKEIRNPYYGDKMLTCGSVEEEIK